MKPKTKLDTKLYGRNKRLFTCYLEPEQLDKLNLLNANTKVPKAVLLREAVDLLFEHRADDLESLDD